MMLIDGEDLEARHGDERLRLYDCTTWLIPDPPRIYRVESGRTTFKDGHIPGADFLDLTGELSDPESGFNFMMPAPEALAKTLVTTVLMMIVRWFSTVATLSNGRRVYGG